nr:unnamed protein product [Spirometra erinaceieuropaei]
MVDLLFRGTDRIFNLFIVYENRSGIFNVLYPTGESRESANRIIDFGPACCKNNPNGEFYVLIFTDADGQHEYVHCLQSGDGHLLCFSSYLPWFECFRTILEEIKTKEFIRRDRLPALKTFLEQLRVLSPPPATKHFFMLTSTSPLFPSGRRVPIPSMVNPYYGKCFEYYYAALDTLQWVDIFVSCLLEKNILFCSRSRERLTLCIIAAITLLHPLSWVLPIYLLLTKKLLEVLQSPVPFIAGIHTCMLEDAKQFLTYGTRIVDLDQRKILVNAPEEDLDSENIPCHIVSSPLIGI